MSMTDFGQESLRITPHDVKYPQHVGWQTPPKLKNPAATLPEGAIVLTLRGALPVEHLQRGDRVVTKSGGTPLKRIHAHDRGYFTLEFNQPEVVYVLDDQYWPRKMRARTRQ